MRHWFFGIVACSGCALVPLSAGWAQNPQPYARTAAPADDLQLVERVLASRREYQQSLEQLREHYRRSGEVDKQRWVEEELLSFHRTSKRAFRLDLDVPPPTLQPLYNIPEANDLYVRATSYMGKGWFGEREDNVRRAEVLYQQLLTNYPQSDKIDDAAFQLGQIYESNVFKQHRRAAQYYERTFNWNQNTQSDARLRAARLYDRTLQERGKAIQLYREIMTHEVDARRIEEARRRLTDLSAATP
jgi:TolA-binding protein